MRRKEVQDTNHITSDEARNLINNKKKKKSSQMLLNLKFERVYQYDTNSIFLPADDTVIQIHCLWNRNEKPGNARPNSELQKTHQNIYRSKKTTYRGRTKLSF